MEGQIHDEITRREQKVIDLLSEAWDIFVSLPEQHPAHKTEMQTAIHSAQRIIMCRPVERAMGWVKEK